MQITMLLHLGHHSITLIFDMPLFLPLIIVVLSSWNWGARGWQRFGRVRSESRITRAGVRSDPRLLEQSFVTNRENFS
jgi:hypothetical protein